MKFETYAYKIVVYHQPNFYKDPCEDTHARGVNARTLNEMRARMRLLRAQLSRDLYENFVGGRLLSYEHKFQIS